MTLRNAGSLELFISAMRIGYTQLSGMLTYIVIGGLNKNCHNCNVTLLVRVNSNRLKAYITGCQHFKSSDPAFHRVARIGRSG